MGEPVGFGEDYWAEVEDSSAVGDSWGQECSGVRELPEHVGPAPGYLE